MAQRSIECLRSQQHATRKRGIGVIWQRRISQPSRRAATRAVQRAASSPSCRTARELGMTDELEGLLQGLDMILETSQALKHWADRHTR